MRLDAQHCDSHNIEENKLYKFFLKKLTTEGTLIIEMIGREDDTEAVIFSIPKNKAEYYNLNEEDTVLVIESEEIEREE